MKGEAENTIVRIVVALIVIGVIVTVLYLGLGPFRASVEYNACLAYLKQQCARMPPATLDRSSGPCSKITSTHQYYNELNRISNCDDV